METRIQAVFPAKDSYKVVDVFGYSTRGLPGVEILGVGKLGRAMKEKFIFISRSLKLPIPHRRYVICAEIDTGLLKKGESDIQFLELPLLLLFWTMAGILPIKRLNDCMCGGKVSVNGKVTDLQIDESVLEKVGESMNGVKVIAAKCSRVPTNISHLSLEGLLNGIAISITK